MLKFEAHRSVRGDEPVRVIRVSQEMLLRHPHAPELRGHVAHQLGVGDVKVAPEIVEGLHDGLAAAGVHLARLVRLSHGQGVSLERPRKFSAMRRMAAWNATTCLPICGRDDGVVTGGGDVGEEFVAIAAGGAHDERDAVRDVQVGVGVDGGGEGIVDDDEAGVLGLEALAGPGRRGWT